MWLLLAIPHALAYETDQLTRRGIPLEDSLSAANDEANDLIARAIARANDLTQCKGSDADLRRAVAFTIYQFTSHSEYVRDRGEFAGLGFGAYSAWMEESPLVDRRDFRDHDDVYGDVTRRDAVILGTVGICSTVVLGGVRLGTDKPDHFFEQGYTYFLESREGRNDRRAKRWGVESELGGFGLLTSNAFSYADLYANWAGYHFYKQLLGPTSVVHRGADGCLEPGRPFDWSDWVDDAMDESLDPPLLGPVVGHLVQVRLQEHRDEYCAGYAQWGGEVEAAKARVLARRWEWVEPSAPPFVDPYDLRSLCEGWSKR